MNYSRIPPRKMTGYFEYIDQHYEDLLIEYIQMIDDSYEDYISSYS